MNTRMRQIDLVTEIVSPFLVGLLLVIPGVSSLIAVAVVALVNFATFFPQYKLLAIVYDTDLRLRATKMPTTEQTATGISNVLWVRYMLLSLSITFG